MGAPLNALSTSDSVASPLLGPRVAWVSLKIAPRNVPVWVLPFLAVAVTSFNEPCSELISDPTGIWRGGGQAHEPGAGAGRRAGAHAAGDVERLAGWRLDEHG